jgi:hypothetical protein
MRFPSAPGAPVLEAEFRGVDVLLYLDGILIAQRGRPGTDRAGTWISMSPGVVVYEREGEGPAWPPSIVVERHGTRIH